MNVIAEITRINEAELKSGAVNTAASWHAKYANSAWCFVGNLPHALSEGDVICFMSQWGEIEDIHLVRDEDTGKSKGFGFVKYEDARSCVLAVDNFCGTKILDRSIRVDHVENYRLPKHLQEKEEEGEEGGETNTAAQVTMVGPGHAYRDQELANKFSLHEGQDLFARPPPGNDYNDNDDDDDDDDDERKRAKRERKEAREQKRREKEQRRQERKKKKERKKDRTDDDSRRLKKRSRHWDD